MLALVLITFFDMIGANQKKEMMTLENMLSVTGDFGAMSICARAAVALPRSFLLLLYVLTTANHPHDLVASLVANRIVVKIAADDHRT